MRVGADIRANPHLDVWTWEAPRDLDNRGRHAAVAHPVRGVCGQVTPGHPPEERGAARG